MIIRKRVCHNQTHLNADVKIPQIKEWRRIPKRQLENILPCSRVKKTVKGRAYTAWNVKLLLVAPKSMCSDFISRLAGKCFHALSAHMVRFGFLDVFAIAR